MSDLQLFQVADFQTQRGGVLPMARLAYRTLGTLNAAGDNAVLMPSWYGGTSADVEASMTGPGRVLDPERHFLILTELFGSGASSSPSNTPPPHERGRFPLVTIHDNVRLQHALLTQRLGVERLRLVTGYSMGAAQTFEWAAQFPEMVRAACPVAGAARTAAFNSVFLLSLRRALELDPAFQDGFYDRPPVAGLRAFATIYAGWGTSEAFFRTGAYRAMGSSTWQEHVADFWEMLFLRRDANDLICQLRTWMAADIGTNARYGGDTDAALRAIAARTIILPVDHDRYFPPVDSEYEASRIPHAECRTIASIWGHMATANPDVTPLIDAAIAELLAD